MTELEAAIRRIEFCADDMQPESDPVICDLKLLISAARESIELKKQQQSAAEILLSDEFMKKFAAAFAATPMPSTIEVWGQK